MAETQEILNIEYHSRRLLLKALNRSLHKKAACGLLGISERTLYRYIREWDIVMDEKTGQYIALRKFFITLTHIV